MAWNRNTNEGAKPTPKKPSALRGALAGLVVIAVAGGIVFFMMSGKDAKPKAKVEKDPTGLIKEVKPAKAPTNTVEDVLVKKDKRAEKPPKDKPEHDPRFDVPPGSYRDKRGILRKPGGMRIMEKPAARHVKFYDEKELEKRLFKNPADDHIAGLLQMKPGGAMLANVPYGRGFEENFKESMKTPIVILPSDDEATRQLKEDVIAVKEEIAERAAKGERIRDIISEMRSELHQLSAYRENLRHDIQNYLDDHENATEQDIKDYVSAANIMLKEKGAEELKLPKAILKKIQRRNGVNK